MQREAAAVIQHSELPHVDFHASLVPACQFRPRAQANDSGSHKMNDNAAAPAGRAGQHAARLSNNRLMADRERCSLILPAPPALTVTQPGTRHRPPQARAVRNF